MVYAISDLHLSTAVDKPMDVFGKKWEGYFEKITENWKATVKEDDIVLIAGDISWGMNFKEAKSDFDLLADLPGKKVILRGNHDYWWSSLSKVKAFLPQNVFPVQNDVLRIGNYLFCGSRGWTLEKSKPDDEKIYARELLRLELSLQTMAKERKEGDIVIGMTHFPPFDVSLQSTAVTDLFDKYGVEKVVYGHLHGDCYAKKNVFIHKTQYYLTSCDLVENKLIKID